MPARALHTIQSWLTPAVTLTRWWRAWTYMDLPSKLQTLIDAVTTGHSIYLDHRMQRLSVDVELTGQRFPSKLCMRANVLPPTQGFASSFTGIPTICGTRRGTQASA